MQDSVTAGAGLVSVPLPFISMLLGLVIAAMILRLDWGVRLAARLFAVLFVLLAVTSGLVGLRFGYGMERIIMVQRLLPLLVGPLMYLGFAAFAFGSARMLRLAGLHLGTALLMVAAIALVPRPLLFLDWVISGSYLLYLVQLLRLWQRGSDHLSLARLDVAPQVRGWMLRAAMLLGAILLFDTAIALDFVLFDGRHVPVMISVAAVPSAVMLLALMVVLPGLIARRGDVRKAAGQEAVGGEGGQDAQAAEVEARAREMLERTQLYLEPDLTVQRMARRLQLPVRVLSASINSTQGMNVSQYVNRFRLAHAADLLKGTDDSVAKVMSQSGFLTRSNFYREFQQAYGVTPAAYRGAG